MVKKFYLMFAMVIILGIFSSMNVLALNIDSCQDLNNASAAEWVLTQNITWNPGVTGGNNDLATCFELKSNAQTLSCSGYNVSMINAGGTPIGVWFNGADNSVVRGCSFSFVNDSSQYGSIGVYVSAASASLNFTITNNTFNDLNSPVDISTAINTITNGSVRNNIFNTVVSTGNQIDITSTSNISITHNNITAKGGTAINIHGNGGVTEFISITNNNITSSSYAVNMQSSVHRNDSISYNNISSGGEAISSSGTNVKIIGNYIYAATQGIGGGTGGVYEGNIINATTTGISASSPATLKNNTITTSSIGISLSAGLNMFIINNTVLGAGTSGIQSTGNTRNITIINNTIGKSGGSFTYGIQLGSGGDQENNTIYNNFLNASTRGIYVNGITGDFNNFSITKISGINIIGGSNLGGNFYPRAALSSETNYAYSCMDSDADGICDIALSFGSNSYDFYPLASVNDVPVFRNNGTSNSAPKVNEGINISANFTDDLELDTITLEHNASGGALTNVSTKANAVSVLNVSFNLTVSATKNQAVAYKFYVNDTRGRTNSSPQAFFTVANTAPTLTHQSQFVNLTQHGFNVSATFNDADGTSDFVNRSITFTSGTCNYLGNKTVGSTGLNLTFNCTGVFPNLNSVVISMNDSSLSAVSATSVSNVYPNNIPAIISNDGSQNRPSINNTPITTQGANVSWNFADLDNDTITNFQISWFVNRERIAKAENSRYLTADNFTTDDIIVAGVNISDGFSSSLTANTTNVTIGDGTPPLILDNFTIPAASVVRDSTIDLFVNATDAKSSISTVTFMVTNPNNVATSHAGTLNSGSSGAGQVSRWTATFTTTTTGNHQVNVTVTDGSSNVARTVQGFLNFTVTAPSGGGDSGTGGGGGSTTVTIQQIISSQDSAKRLLVIQTPVGAVSTDQLLWGGQSRKVPFHVFSLANFSQQASLSCISPEGICSYLTFEKTIIDLPVSDQPQKTFFTLSLPEQDFGFSRQSGIIFAADVSSGANATFKVTVTTVPRALGIPFYAFSTLFQFPQVKAGQGSFPFPNVFVFLVLPELLMIIFAAQSRNPAVLKHRLTFISLTSLIVLVFAVTASYLLTTSSLVV